MADWSPMMYEGLLSVTDGTSLASGRTLRILSRSHPLLMIGHKRVKGKAPVYWWQTQISCPVVSLTEYTCLAFDPSMDGHGMILMPHLHIFSSICACAGRAGSSNTVQKNKWKAWIMLSENIANIFSL